MKERLYCLITTLALLQQMYHNKMISAKDYIAFGKAFLLHFGFKDISIFWNDQPPQKTNTGIPVDIQPPARKKPPKQPSVKKPRSKKKHKTKHEPSPESKKPCAHTCSRCGKQFIEYASHHRRYCSRECYFSARYGK